MDDHQDKIQDLSRRHHAPPEYDHFDYDLEKRMRRVESQVKQIKWLLAAILGAGITFLVPLLGLLLVAGGIVYGVVFGIVTVMRLLDLAFTKNDEIHASFQKQAPRYGEKQNHLNE